MKNNEEDKVCAAIYASALLINENYRHEFIDEKFCKKHIAVMKKYFSYDIDHKNKIFETIKAHFKNSRYLANIDCEVEVKSNEYIVTLGNEEKKESISYSTKNFQTHIFSLFCRFLYAKDSELTTQNLSKVNLTLKFIKNFRAAYLPTGELASIESKCEPINSYKAEVVKKDKQKKQHQKPAKNKTSKNNDTKASKNKKDDDAFLDAFLDKTVKENKKDGVDKLISFASNSIKDYLGDLENYSKKEQEIIGNVYKLFDNIKSQLKSYKFKNESLKYDYDEATKEISIFLARKEVKDMDSKYKIIFLPFAIYPIMKYLNELDKEFFATNYVSVFINSLLQLLLTNVLEKNKINKFEDLDVMIEPYLACILDESNIQAKPYNDKMIPNDAHCIFSDVNDFIVVNYMFDLQKKLNFMALDYQVKHSREIEIEGSCEQENMARIKYYLKILNSSCKELKKNSEFYVEGYDREVCYESIQNSLTFLKDDSDLVGGRDGQINLDNFYESLESNAPANEEGKSEQDGSSMFDNVKS